MKNKTALITGGTSGIGLDMAHVLASKGYSIILVSNQKEELNTCRVEIIRLYKVSCSTFYADLSSEKSAGDVFDFCASQGFVVHILINNAGMLVFSEMVSAPHEKVRSILQLHINTPVMLCRLFGEQMKNRKEGYILNVSSISAVMPYPGISLYGPSKTFLRYFTRALRTEMQQYGVGVTCLIPGATATGLYDPNKVNLSLAKKVGVMQSSYYVAHKAIHSLFKKKAECIPGIINKLTICLLPLVPHFIIQITHRKTGWVKSGENALNS